MSSRITHAGIIDSIEGEHVRVRIVQQAACASCKVASHCNASEQKEKIVDVYTSQGGLRTGQHVVVSTSGKAVRHALLLGFGVPLILLMGILIASKMSGCGDETSALLGLGALVPYYIGIWLFQNTIARSISFQIEEGIKKY